MANWERNSTPFMNDDKDGISILHKEGRRLLVGVGSSPKIIITLYFFSIILFLNKVIILIYLSFNLFFFMISLMSYCYNM